MYCVNNTYGMNKCDIHDAHHEPDCLNNPGFDNPDRPDFCDEPWCYVDAETCGNSSHIAYLTSVLLTTGGTPPSYSYTACGGDASSWLDILVVEGLRGKTLRAGIPTVGK